MYREPEFELADPCCARPRPAARALRRRGRRARRGRRRRRARRGAAAVAAADAAAAAAEGAAGLSRRRRAPSSRVGARAAVWQPAASVRTRARARAPALPPVYLRTKNLVLRAWRRSLLFSRSVLRRRYAYHFDYVLPTPELVGWLCALRAACCSRVLTSALACLLETALQLALSARARARGEMGPPPPAARVVCARNRSSARAAPGRRSAPAGAAAGGLDGGA